MSGREDWQRFGPVRRGILQVNRCLAGRMLIAPLFFTLGLIRHDLRLIARGDRPILRAWLLHLATVPVVLVLVIQVGGIPFWLYALACYAALSVLSIRTFLEHRAGGPIAERSVIIERGSVLGFLFLNNHLHALHHAQPEVPWHRLPALYRRERDRILRRNGGYGLSRLRRGDPALSAGGRRSRRSILRRCKTVPHRRLPERRHAGVYPVPDVRLARDSSRNRRSLGRDRGEAGGAWHRRAGPPRPDNAGRRSVALIRPSGRPDLRPALRQRPRRPGVAARPPDLCRGRRRTGALLQHSRRAPHGRPGEPRRFPGVRRRLQQRNLSIRLGCFDRRTARGRDPRRLLRHGPVYRRPSRVDPGGRRRRGGHRRHRLRGLGAGAAT